MQFILAIVLALRKFHSGVASLHCHCLEEFLSMQGLLPGTVHVKKSLNFLHAHLVYIFFLLHAVRPLRHIEILDFFLDFFLPLSSDELELEESSPEVLSSLDDLALLETSELSELSFSWSSLLDVDGDFFLK